MAGMLDALNFLAWAQTKDGADGKNRPKSVMDMITGQKRESDVVKFKSGSEFEAARRKLLGEHNGD